MGDSRSYSRQPFAFLMKVLPGIPFVSASYQPAPSPVARSAAMPAANVVPLYVLRGRRTSSTLISLGRLIT